MNKLSKKQSAPTQYVQELVDHFLQYLLWHPTTSIVFKPSNMQLSIHSDASYLSEPGSHSRAAGVYWMGTNLPFNGPIDVLTTTIKVVVSAASEAEYGAAFLNATHAIPFISALNFLGHPQQPVPLTMDNQVAWGIVNGKVKAKQSKAMCMRFHWLKDREAQKQFKFLWDRGSDNLADYFTKIHPVAHYRDVRSTYVTDIPDVSHLEGVL